MLSAVLLSACALQPQVLPITPRLDVSGAAHRGDRVVDIAVDQDGDVIAW